MRAMRKSVFSRPPQGRFFVAAVLVAVFLGVFGPMARAGDNRRATAKAHYETATRLYDIREYDKALLEYKSAYLAQPDPAFLFNIGQCHRKLGQNQQALNFFQEYLKKASPDDPNRSQVEARIRDIEAEAKLQAEAAQAAAAATPAPAPEVVPPAPTPATAAVAATPTAPAASVEQAVPVNTTPEGSGRGLRIAGIACGAAGLASVGIGIYYYTRARSLSDRVTNSQNPKASDDQAGRDAQTMQWVFYGIGAGALATGTVLYLLGWPSNPAGRTVATPIVGPGLVGISAQGTF
jgi:tetratricopeptide (TPR) repeat protein